MELIGTTPLTTEKQRSKEFTRLPRPGLLGHRSTDVGDALLQHYGRKSYARHFGKQASFCIFDPFVPHVIICSPNKCI
jgi:hypothetical protein